MVHASAFTVAAAALLAALPVNAGMYAKDSSVVQLTAKNYDSLIAKSNYTSIVEFYAPWCGHCKNLKPAYEKAAQNLAGLAKVAAIDCDEELNKPFCGGMGVQGFPTLKIVRPGKKAGKPIVEDYQGPRTAKGIVEAVIDKIPNLVKKVEDKSLESFLAEANQTAKGILFTDKGKTSALIKAVAIEFKGSIIMATIRDKEKASVELFGITKYPTLILLPGGAEAEGLVYDGQLTKEGIVKFFSQAAAPNPDPASAKAKSSKPKDSKKASMAKEPFEKPSKSQASSEGSASAASAAKEVVDEPTESPSPEVDTEKPADLPVPDPAPPISLLSEAELALQCMGPRTGTCILALLPPKPDDLTLAAIKTLSEVSYRHFKASRKIFPFYAVTPDIKPQERIREKLGLSQDLEVIAVNGRRGWWRSLPRVDVKIVAKDVTDEALDNWVDAIRLGEGAKRKMPEGLIPEEPVVEEPFEEAQEPLTEEPVIEEKSEEPVEEISKEPKEDTHDEL